MTVPTHPPSSASHNDPSRDATGDGASVVWMASWRRRRRIAPLPTAVDSTAVASHEPVVLDPAGAAAIRMLPRHGPEHPAGGARTDAQREAVKALLDAIHAEAPRRR